MPQPMRQCAGAFVHPNLGGVICNPSHPMMSRLLSWCPLICLKEEKEIRVAMRQLGKAQSSPSAPSLLDNAPTGG